MPLKTSSFYDVIVIGGGIIGSSTAFYLSLRGRKVLILEKKFAAREASGTNAGGIRRLGRHLSEIPLSIESLKLWHELQGMSEIDCEFKACGQVRVAENEQEMAKLEKRATLTRSLGYEHEELIDRAELRKLIPTIADHCIGAMVVREDGATDPYRTSRSIFRAALKHGAKAMEQTLVESIEPATNSSWHVRCGEQLFETPVVVNCAGAWGACVAKMVGDDAPVHVEAPTMMVSARVAPFLKTVVGLAGRRLSFKQTSEGTVLIGGGYRSPIDMKTEKAEISISELTQAARTVTEVFPHMKNVPILRSWNGIEGVTPDHIPIICPSPNAVGIFHAIGFSAHGLQLGPIVGKIMTDLVLDGKTTLPIEPFHINRFSSKLEKLQPL